MSEFGDLVKRLRKEREMTLEAVAKKIGSHKGYVSGIENGKVNPPSVKVIRKFARLFKQDERGLVRMAWVDKAPALIRDEARRFLAQSGAKANGSKSAGLLRVPILNTRQSGYATALDSKGRPVPLCDAALVLPHLDPAPEFAVTLCDDSMAGPSGTGLSSGDLVLVAACDRAPSGSLVYLIFTRDDYRQALVRHAVHEKNENLVLQPANREYPLEFLTWDNVDAVLRVVGRIVMSRGEAMVDVVN